MHAALKIGNEHQKHLGAIKKLTTQSVLQQTDQSQKS